MRRVTLWGLVVASTAGMIVGTVAYLLVGGEADGLGWVLLGPVPILVAGIYLMVRHPGNRIADYVTLTAVFGFAIPVPMEALVTIRYDEGGPAGWMWLPMLAAMTSSLIGLVFGTHMISLLTDGRFRNPVEKWYLTSLWALLVFPVLLLLTSQFVPHEAVSFAGIDDVSSPIFVPALETLGPAIEALRVSSSVLFVGGIVLLWHRYRTGEVGERRRLRWVLFGVALAVAFGIMPFVIGEIIGTPLEHGWLLTLLYLPVLALPVSIVFAVEEPTWLDVDFVIRRSFAYAVLSLSILILYAAAAAAFGLAAGSRLPVEIAIVITVVVAIAFQPIRRRLQSIADRWVFGDRPTAFDVISHVDASIDSADGPGEMLTVVADVVARAIGARWVRITITEGAVITVGQPSDSAVIVASLEHAGRKHGSIECGGRLAGSYDDDDARLVGTIAHQVGLSLSNLQLASRLVNAQEMERRRIERNIHDGAQQELVALVGRLGLARSALLHGDLDASTLADLQAEATAILKDLRELAQGIHPSVLADGGLLEAIEDRCGRLPIDVSLEAPDALRSERYADQVEGAAYFFVTEGLANVLKHADAHLARVSFNRNNGQLVLSIVDDGTGFDRDHTRARGLAGLEDRIVALGGKMVVDSEPGHGTRLEAVIPVDRVGSAR